MRIIAALFFLFAGGLFSYGFLAPGLDWDGFFMIDGQFFVIVGSVIALLLGCAFLSDSNPICFCNKKERT